MILELFLQGIFGVVSNLLFFELPKLPADVYGYIDTIFDYITAGASIVANYVPLDYLMVLFGVLLAVDAGIMVYHFVMWILRKIPLAGIS